MSEERVARRLAAILAADVVGYSRLISADEEGTLRRMRQLRSALFDPAIENNSGRVFKRTGDGILAEFASVVDAVRCSVAVQQGLAARNRDIATAQRIEVRIGIHLGDVIVESDGDLMGDGVNIAARLEGIAVPGGICLSRAAHDQVEGKVATQFLDIGDQELKNIARPMRVFAIDPIAAAPQPPAASPGPPRLSIVVLPFANISGDPEQDYFVDGVTESLTTDLSRLAGSFVIGRNTAFTYKGKAVELKQIGRELNVRYVLEGSVQRGGSRMRVNVQLIDAKSGNHLWAERFDKSVGDLFDMQDEIVARLARELGSALNAHEARRAARAPNPDSLDLYFQGMALYEQSITRETLSDAQTCFERALAIDPGNVDALAGLAQVIFALGEHFRPDDRDMLFAAAEASAKKALSLAPDHVFGHFALGLVYRVTGRAEEAIAEFERAVELDCNFAPAHAFIGAAKYILGRAEETEAHVREALRLSPRDAWAAIWMAHAGGAKLCLRAYGEAVAWLRRSIEANRNYERAHFFLAATLAHLGRLDEARSVAQTGLALVPGRTIKTSRRSGVGAHPVYVAQLEHIIDGLRLAGVPEG